MGCTRMDGETKEFKMWIQESRMWSWHHEEISESGAKAFEWESANESTEAKF